MYVAVEGWPALGKSELLSALRLYYPTTVLVLPELVKEVCEQDGLDLFRDRHPLAQRLGERRPPREALIRQALEQGRTVVEESHLAVHAAYSAALGDSFFLAEFARLEKKILWPELFVRLEAPVEVSGLRQQARGDPRYMVQPHVLEAMRDWLVRWHEQRGSRVVVLDADRPPHEVLHDLVQVLGLAYRPHVVDRVLPYLVLLGRPASGKSELVQFLQGLEPGTRVRHYHLGKLRVLDDFPILWQKFVEDDRWEAVGRGRLHSRRSGENYAVADDHLWNFLILALNDAVAKQPAGPGETVLMEFSRGGPQGYRRALELLSPEVLRQGAILYLGVSFEESWRRNVARYDRDHRDGLLTHSVPREEMERTYLVDDWKNLATGRSGYLSVQGVQVPYVTVLNEPEPKTTRDFAERFRPALDELFGLWNNRP